MYMNIRVYIIVLYIYIVYCVLLSGHLLIQGVKLVVSNAGIWDNAGH